MTLTPDQQRAVAFLRDLTKEGKLKLRLGAMLREEMLSALKKGDKPGGYRYNWLNRTAAQILQRLTALAELFNIAHPGDQISTTDLIDVLKVAADKLREKDQ